MKAWIYVLVWLSLSGSVFAEVSITTATTTTKENQIKQSLENLLRTHDIEQWIYTKDVIVHESARTPRSHPVLTMSTQPEYLNSETKLLATFLHEQFHWHVVLNGKPSKQAFRALIAEKFPDPKWQRPYGSGDEGGTLSHLIVCYLEYKALVHLVGWQKAYENVSTNGYYTWVYQMVTDPANKQTFERLLDEFELNILKQKS